MSAPPLPAEAAPAAGPGSVCRLGACLGTRYGDPSGGGRKVKFELDRERLRDLTLLLLYLKL